MSNKISILFNSLESLPDFQEHSSMTYDMRGGRAILLHRNIQKTICPHLCEDFLYGSTRFRKKIFY